MSEHPKPEKPRPDFPLFAHASGQWAKKIRGRLHYFGIWADPQAALERYLNERDDMLAGRNPRVVVPAPSVCTVGAAVNRFLHSRHQKRQAGELSHRTVAAYTEIGRRIVAALGRHTPLSAVGPAEFSALRAELATTLGPLSLATAVQQVRAVFRFAHEHDLIDRPVRFGPSFTKPSARVLRQHRTASGPKVFEPSEILAILDACGPVLRAMVLLGINCGFGNHDCATLPVVALDLDRGWLSHPRPKTAVERRCSLWSETVTALRDVLTRRPKPRMPEWSGLVFLTHWGRPWYRDAAKPHQPVTLAFDKILASALKGKRRRGVAFYALRHTFETVGGDGGDQVAVNFLMGHAPRADDMSSVYREWISDDRLLAVSARIHAWLFGPGPAEPASE